MKIRIVYFDFLRGLTILMVIAIHTFSIVDLTSDSNFEIFLRQILNCAVPIFLAISGFFISKGNKVGTYCAFLKHQIPRIYIPCLLWSVPYLLLYLNHNGDVFKALFYFIFCGFSIYYFIALIIQYYILFPVLIKLKSGGGNSIDHVVGYFFSNVYYASGRSCASVDNICRRISSLVDIFCYRLAFGQYVKLRL